MLGLTVLLTRPIHKPRPNSAFLLNSCYPSPFLANSTFWNCGRGLPLPGGKTEYGQWAGRSGSSSSQLVLSASMRRPVGVKNSFRSVLTLAERDASAATLPSALCVERLVARCNLGVLVSVSVLSGAITGPSRVLLFVRGSMTGTHDTAATDEVGSAPRVSPEKPKWARSISARK